MTCSDLEDRVTELERELAQAHRSLSRIHVWLGRIYHLEVEPTPENVSAAIEDAYNEAAEQVSL